MSRTTLPSIALSALAILACGAIGVAAGLAVARWIGLAGTTAAVTAAVVAMPVAGAAFALGVLVLKRLGVLR